MILLLWGFNNQIIVWGFNNQIKPIKSFQVNFSIQFKIKSLKDIKQYH